MNLLVILIIKQAIIWLFRPLGFEPSSSNIEESGSDIGDPGSNIGDSGSDIGD